MIILSRWAVRRGVRLLILLIVTSVLVLGVAQSQTGPEGACAVTPEMIYGQGYYPGSVAYSNNGANPYAHEPIPFLGMDPAFQGGYAFPSILDGTEPDEPVPPRERELLDQYRLDTDWLNIQSSTGNVGYEAVGVLIIDDFSQPTSNGNLVLEVYEDMYSQLINDFQSGISLNAPPPVIFVTLPINEINYDVNRLGEIGYDPATIIDEIYGVVRYFRDGQGFSIQSIDRWVINMSFNVMPCRDTALGWSLADDAVIDFEDFMDTEWASWNAEYPDVGGTLDYSFYDYLQFATGGDFWYAQEMASYLYDLMRVDSADFDIFETYLSDLLTTPDKDIVMVGAAGDYREWAMEFDELYCKFDPTDTTDTGACEPFAPARWDSVIATAALLDPDPDVHGVPLVSSNDNNLRNTFNINGERSQMWLASLDGQVIAPGSWYLFNDGWYRGGTSFATAFAGMAYAMNLTHPNQLNCEGVYSSGAPLQAAVQANLQANAILSVGSLCPLYDTEGIYRRLTLGENSMTLDDFEFQISRTESPPFRGYRPGDTLNLSFTVENISPTEQTGGSSFQLYPLSNDLDPWRVVGGTTERGQFNYDGLGYQAWDIGNLPPNSQGAVTIDLETTISETPSNKLIVVDFYFQSLELNEIALFRQIPFVIGSEISGVVQDELGQPLENVQVIVSDANSILLSGTFECTDANGAFQFTGVSYFEVNISAIYTGEFPCGASDYTYLQNENWLPSNQTSFDLTTMIDATGVNLSLVPDAAPAMVSNVTPTNDIQLTGTDLIVTWEPVAGASRYRIFVRDEDTEGDYGAIYDDTVQEFTYVTDTDICTGSLCVFENDLPPQGRYSIFIQSINNTGTSAWEGPHYFRVGNAPLPPTGVPVILSPSNPTDDLTADLTWAAIDRASKYDVLVYEYDTSTWVVRDPNLNNGTLGCASLCTYHVLHTEAQEDQAGVGLTNNYTYAMFVRAKSRGGYGPYTDRYIVYADATADFEGNIPRVIAPDGMVTATEPVIGWLDTERANRYRVVVQNMGGVVLDETISAGNACTDGTCTLPILGGLAVGDYQVNVSGLQGNTTSDWSNTIQFTVVDDTQ